MSVLEHFLPLPLHCPCILVLTPTLLHSQLLFPMHISLLFPVVCSLVTLAEGVHLSYPCSLKKDMRRLFWEWFFFFVFIVA